MIRLKHERNKWYGIFIDSIESDAENITAFIENNEGPVIIVQDLTELEEIGIDHLDVEMID